VSRPKESKPNKKLLNKSKNLKDRASTKGNELSESECSTDPDDWRPQDGPHPSD